MIKNKQLAWTFVVLGLVMLLTRGSHFGTSYLLPDASVAIFFLGGLLLRRSWAFASLLIVAFLVDIWAINFQNVPAYCFTPAYVGLLPTYGALWFAGLWLSRQAQPFEAKPFFALALASSLLAFVISNAFFYGFSGHFATMTAADFAAAVQQYLPEYVGFSLVYAGAAWLGRFAWISSKSAQQSASH